MKAFPRPAPQSFIPLFLVLALPLFLLISGAAAAQEGIGAGPLLSHNTHPLYTALPQWLPREADVESPGSAAFTLLQSYANNYFYIPPDAEDSTIVAHIDGEAWYTTLAGSIGVVEGLELNLSLRTALHYAGIFDPFLSGYHHLFGFPNAGRDLEPPNRHRVYLENDSAVLIDSSASFFEPNALQIEVRGRLYSSPGGHSRLAGGAMLKLPLASTSHPLSGSGADAGVRLYYSLRCGAFDLHASGGAALLRRPDFLAAEYFTPLTMPYSLSLHWTALRRWILGATIQGTTSPFSTGYGRVDRPSSAVTFGSEWVLGERNRLQLSMSQEFITFAASDVAVNVVWRYQLSFSER